jgi:hypothetical protein
MPASSKHHVATRGPVIAACVDGSARGSRSPGQPGPRRPRLPHVGLRGHRASRSGGCRGRLPAVTMDAARVLVAAQQHRHEHAPPRSPARPSRFCACGCATPRSNRRGPAASVTPWRGAHARRDRTASRQTRRDRAPRRPDSARKARLDARVAPHRRDDAADGRRRHVDDRAVARARARAHDARLPACRPRAQAANPRSH